MIAVRPFPAIDAPPRIHLNWEMKQLTRLFIGGLSLLVASCSASLSIDKLRCEYLVDPLGIDAAHPRLSWVLDSSGRDEKQTAYHILVASSPRLLDKGQGDLWDSGKVLSDETAQIACQGSPLSSRERCFWKVRVWDAKDHPSSWSAVGHWEMGLLQPKDWSAQWITAQTPAPVSDRAIDHPPRDLQGDRGWRRRRCHGGLDEPDQRQPAYDGRQQRYA